MKSTIHSIESDIKHYTKCLEDNNLSQFEQEYLQNKIAKLQKQKDQYYNGKNEDYDLTKLINYKEVAK